jgi:hypothetical protein
MKAYGSLLVFFLLTQAGVAQVFVDESPLYQLQEGTTGTDKIRYLPDGRGQLIVRPDQPDQQVYSAAQVAFFHQNHRRFESVANFTVRLTGNRTVRIDQDFAMLLDTGRVRLLEHLVSGTLPGKGEAQVYSQWSYLLQVKGRQELLVIRDSSNKYDDGAFSSYDQRLLLQVFGNDPNLQQLLTQQKLTCRNFPAYVRAYNGAK